MKRVASSLAVPVSFLLNCLAIMITLGSSIIVLFGDILFSESIAETSKPYLPLFWMILLLSMVSFYFSLPNLLHRQPRVGGSLFAILGLSCIGMAIHDQANGLANGDDPLIVLFIPGLILMFTGVWHGVFQRS